MTDQDREQFCKVIAALAATFRQEATEALYEGYWLALRDLPLAAIQQAAARALRESRFMPVGAELRELAGAMSLADRGVRAWDVAKQAEHRHGYYATVDFDDRVINATIRSMGGWERFSERLEEEEEKWLRKDFEKLYASFARGGVSPEACAPLLGFHDRQNAFHGYHKAIGKPLLIGCGLPPHRPGVMPQVTATPVRQIAAEVRECVDSIGRLPQGETV